MIQKQLVTIGYKYLIEQFLTMLNSSTLQTMQTSVLKSGVQYSFSGALSGIKKRSIEGLLMVGEDVLNGDSDRDVFWLSSK